MKQQTGLITQLEILSSKMASKTLQDKLTTANSERVDFSELFSPQLYSVVTSNADAIGAPVEFLAYPLLTVAASFMGINAHVRVNPEWTEPAILWFVVAAKKGEKTAALRRLRAPLEDLEKQLQKRWQTSQEADKPPTPPQLMIDHFSFEELHSVMKRNGGQILGLFDEISSLYAQLDLFKHSNSTMDRKTLISLNGGGAWARNYRSYTAVLDQTAFNVTGNNYSPYIVACM